MTCSLLIERPIEEAVPGALIQGGYRARAVEVADREGLGAILLPVVGVMKRVVWKGSPAFEMRLSLIHVCNSAAAPCMPIEEFTPWSARPGEANKRGISIGEFPT